MFLVDMHFTDMSKITPELTTQHRDYLAKQYKNGLLMFGGRKEPRTGGIILSKHSDEAELQVILAGDPFIQSGAVRVNIVPFTPVMASSQYQHLLE